jgi:hypothetical protein
LENPVPSAAKRQVLKLDNAFEQEAGGRIDF